MVMMPTAHSPCLSIDCRSHRTAVLIMFTLRPLRKPCRLPQLSSVYQDARRIKDPSSLCLSKSLPQTARYRPHLATTLIPIRRLDRMPHKIHQGRLYIDLTRMELAALMFQAQCHPQPPVLMPCTFLLQAYKFLQDIRLQLRVLVDDLHGLAGRRLYMVLQCVPAKRAEHQQRDL